MLSTCHHIVLCGGIGSRLKAEVSLPKPLGLVLGIPLIQHVLPSIPSEKISVISGNHLEQFNFENLIHHLTDKEVNFTYIKRPTRGPIESAYLGIKLLRNIRDEEPIIFYDNDTIYNGISLPEEATNAIGFLSVEDPSKSYQYCFLDIEQGRIVGIHEKEQVSNKYAAGIYAFKSKKYFLEKAKE